MVKNRFRSQPTLQRSGGGASWAPISVSLAVLAAAGALGAYGLAHFRDSEPAPVAEARTDAPSNVDLALAEVANPPVVQVPAFAPAAEAAPVAQAPGPQQAAPKRVAKRKATEAAPAQAVDEAAVVAAARERQQKDYEAAVAKYDASEREEGYRWAKTNRVRTARYCRTTAKRTDAFMEGCLSFVSQVTGRGAPSGSSPSASGERASSET